MNLRNYQQDAHDAAIEWVRHSKEPCLLDLPTGSGKSLIVAAIAKTLHEISGGKHILCLAPKKELIEQNSEKFRATGNPCSIFSASLNKTCLKHPVVFGTEITVKNKIHRFGPKFCAVIVDEAHRITPTIKSIIEAIQQVNPNVRVIGLTATPYRLGSGYIYQIDPNNKINSETTAKNPYFKKCVYKVEASYLIEKGYLSPPSIGAIHSDSYETIGMQVNNRGQFNKSDVDQAYHGKGRLTSRIVHDVVMNARDRQGVMIFAATIQHAHEIMESLPPSLSAIVTGETKLTEREAILRRFKERKIKYITNVDVLTTGFDAPHVDVIALLRATESVSLLQQIIGRGLRINEGKENCLILDYAQNLDRHCPDGDVFNPTITAHLSSGSQDTLIAECPVCNCKNEFIAKANTENLGIDKYGYFVDLEGHQIKTDYGPASAHWGRRCNGLVMGQKVYVQCGYRWTFKECPHCEADNDIAARYCVACKGELIDPNEKLVADFMEKKKDPTKIQTDKVILFDARETISMKGNHCIMLHVKTEYRSFKAWLMKDSKEHRLFNMLEGRAPETITYKKKGEFFRIFGYNGVADEIPC